MPIFEYKCQKCEKLVSIFLKNSDESNVKCPECGSKKLKKQMSTFAGVVKESKPAPSGCGGCQNAPMCPNAKF
ncbi:MAG: zinc ribbon domain-containing protein [Sedimentisphaeraceae bacterium JB056]